MSFEEILNAVFGGSVSVDKIISILVAIFAVVKTFTEWRAKKKLIKAEKEQTAALEELKVAREEIKQLKTCVSKFGDVMLTAYLSSNTVPVEVKQHIGTIGSELNKIADIPLADTTNKLIQIVTEVVPDNALNEHKEELEEASKLTEDVIDGANDLVQNAIDKIKVS
jgi:hypothetical protein